MNSNNSIAKFVKLPDVLSLCNGLCGVISIFLSLNGYAIYAAILLFASGIFDFLDGRIARKLGLSSEFGKQLDSLCDIISFILAPIIFAASFSTVTIALKLPVLAIYFLAGALRLARFNVVPGDGKYFEGVPVPFSLFIMASYLIVLPLGINDKPLIMLFLVHSFLMVSTIKIKKF